MQSRAALAKTWGDSMERKASKTSRTALHNNKLYAEGGPFSFNQIILNRTNLVELYVTSLIVTGN